MQKYFFRLPLIATLITFLAVVTMFTLGVWQLDRAEEKRVRLQTLENAQKAANVELAEVARNPTDNADMPVTLNGQADSSHYFLLDNKIHQGRVGYHVIVPIKTQAGWIVANFGWVSATHSRDVLPEVQITSNKMKYSGIVWLPNKNVLVNETAKLDGIWPKVIQEVDLKVLQQHYEQTFLPFVVKLSHQPDSKFVRVWQAVVMPPEKHVAYAVQWFLLAFAALAIFFIAQLKRRKREPV